MKKKCSFCGKDNDIHLHLLEEPEDSMGRIMAEKDVCFLCAFWFEKVAVKDNPLIARVNGSHYWIEENDTCFKGFGGHGFTILFDDGRVVDTANLWVQGVIPPHFQDQLPNNAQFVQ